MMEKGNLFGGQIVEYICFPKPSGRRDGLSTITHGQLLTICSGVREKKEQRWQER